MHCRSRLCRRTGVVAMIVLFPGGPSRRIPADSAHVGSEADSEAGRRRAASSERRVASGSAHTASGGGFDGQSEGVR